MPKQNDFENRFFDQLQESFKDIKGDIKELNDATKVNTRHLEKVNGRLGKLEAEVFAVHKETASQLPLWWKDWKNVRVVLWVVLAFFAIVLAFKGVDVNRLVGN